MSSRAVRKLQKLREQQLEPEQEESEEESPPHKRNFNAFDLLNADDNESSPEEGEEKEAESEPDFEPVPSPKPKKASKNKKKKKANRTKNRAIPDENSGDEIDRALQDLAAKDDTHIQPTRSTFPKTTNELLNTESKFLNANHEMRRLFGNVVLETFEEPNQQAGDLGSVLSGRSCPASQGRTLAGVKLRRNPLMPAKDDWPQATSGGLGMDLVVTHPHSVGDTVYSIVNTEEYQRIQNQFHICVESMDTQRMIHLLVWNPYHISTLIQVSQLAKHQGDHAVSADLLERALFTIGRSAHHTFGNALMEGRARLDFVESANRELWLAGWRYIENLGMKGTWRTAYEWSKLLLSLNNSDPYCMKLTIDQLALRGREYAHFVDLCTQTRFSEVWAHLPNIQCSLALAYLRLNKAEECRDQLTHAMSRFPWIFNKIAQELDLQPVPKYIWGSLPPDASHELLTALYIARAKDLWNTPESISLIMEVADTLSGEPKRTEYSSVTITLDMARHVILSDIQSVTTHLPREFFEIHQISSSDPLPPNGAYEDIARGDANHPEGTEEGADSGANGNVEPVVNRDHWRNLERLHQQFDDQLIYLANEGISILQQYVRVNGIDRGNWNEADITPVWGYVKVFIDIPAGMQEMIFQMMRSRSDCGPFYEVIVKEEMERFAETFHYLTHEGLEEIRQFIHLNGVDRGNWEDPTPAWEYVKSLIRMPFRTQMEVLHMISYKHDCGLLYAVAVEGEMEKLLEERQR
ncbi:hypothetical protein N7495_001701 [Penicillium taxi]|uniref:uncharacterized protein n=1 Tax=Penicillium taxi TaxID=168475 RepID=UPI002545B59D|nr:uncharacterized protein N7495_001701 [Penicillium taxi]KAJ5909019.1 hypothetical protein N7495_001701 [Penicillium taxi]